MCFPFSVYLISELIISKRRFSYYSHILYLNNTALVVQCGILQEPLLSIGRYFLSIGRAGLFFYFPVFIVCVRWVYFNVFYE